MPRKIAIFTGSRAEYGLLYPIISRMIDDDRLEPLLIVSGSHVKDGGTIHEIERDGIPVAAVIPCDETDDNLLGTTSAIGSVITRLGPVLASLDPAITLIYGDRFESFGAMVASTQMRIPTAHVEGGDYTDGGALDDMLRHAMTKLAHVHFTTNADAASRVSRLGEETWRITNVGLPALDLIALKQYAGREQILARFQLDPSHPVLLFTQHSVATEFEHAGEQIDASLDALEFAVKNWNCQVVMTHPNDDAGGSVILNRMAAFARRDLSGVQLHASLGRHYYHGMLALASACVGNSSSGVKETPAFHCPTVNIGTRQRGRLCAENVIHTGYERGEIINALECCLFDEAFHRRVVGCRNPYGTGSAGVQICEILASMDLDDRLIQKRMTF